MILLTLDQSSHITGWSIFENEELKIYGKFSFEDNDVSIRLLNIKNTVKTLITQYKPDKVVIEDIQLQNNVVNNVQTFKILAELYGVLITLFTELKIPYSTILASSWKSRLSIKGKTRAEQKRNAQNYVLNTYNVKVVQDIADAICIGAASLKEDQCAWSV